MTSFEALVKFSERCVIVHPRYLLRPHLLGSIQANFPMRYVAFRGTNIDLYQAHEQLSDMVSPQKTDLDTPTWVILDETDCLQPQALTQLVQEFLRRQDVVKLLVMGRVMPMYLFHSEVASQIAFYPVDEPTMFFDYRQTVHAQKILLEVYTLGMGQTFINGMPLQRWDGWLPRVLFYYMIDRVMVRRDDIFQTFWPNLNEREATNVFHVSKRKVHEMLGFDLTVYDSGYYYLSPDLDIRYDVRQFNKLVQQAQVVPDSKAVVHLNNALSLYRSDFLSGFGGDWVVTRRAQLRRVYAETLQLGFELCQRLGDSETAAQYRTLSEQILLSTLAYSV